MTRNATPTSQNSAARLAGFLFLFLMATAVFGEFVVRSSLIVPGGPAETARNLMERESLFRVGIAGELVSFAGIVVLALTLYVLLEAVNRNLALVAAAWRLCEASLLAVAAVGGSVILQLLNDPVAAGAFEPNQLNALAMLTFDAQSAFYDAGLVFYSLGSTVFAYLLLRSNFVPRVLAAWGILASLLVLGCNFAIILFPDLATNLLPGCYAPVFFYEVALGFWLLYRGAAPVGVRSSRTLPVADARG